MDRMGSSCSAQRNNNDRDHQPGTNASSRRRRSEGRSGGGGSDETGGSLVKRTSLRYSVVSVLPDQSIADLYPKDDNYVNVEGCGGSLRSPKTLTELATDALCRSLPNLQGSLPAGAACGIPQDVVDCILHSLQRHSALNATTLRALQNCELGHLDLSGCRGVTDAWLAPLGKGTRKFSTLLMYNSSEHERPPCLHASPDDTFLTMSTEGASATRMFNDNNNNSSSSSSSSMDTDERLHLQEIEHSQSSGTSSSDEDIFYGTCESPTHQQQPMQQQQKEDESSSHSSFVTARSHSHCTLTPSSSNEIDHHQVLEAVDSTFSEQYHQLPSIPSQNDYNGVYDTASPSFGESMIVDNSIHDESKLQANTNAPSPLPLSSHLTSSSPPSFPSFYPAPSSHCITTLDLRGSQRLTDRGLMHLTNLSNLEVARLDHCHSLQGRGLVALSSSHRLRTLSLAHCRRLTDEAIINIAHLRSLQDLLLEGCRCLTDRALVAMHDLIDLRTLDISQCDLITDEGLTLGLEHLVHVQDLNLGWCRQLTNVGLDTITQQEGRSEHLLSLGLARCTALTDAGVVHLQRLAALTKLILNGCTGMTSSGLGKTLEKLTNITDLDVSYCPGVLRSSWQGKISGLQSLQLCYSNVRDSHLARLTKLPALLELNLDSCPVGDWAIGHLADNGVTPNLTSLNLADTDLTDLGMEHIAKFTKMKRLSLFYCNISNNGLRHIAKLTELEVLNLDSRDIGDDGLRHLGRLRKLKSLDIFSGRITDTGCGHIAQISSLQSLELCGGGVGDLGCTLLAATLENLTWLNLSQNERISNRGAAALAALTDLEALNLSNTRVTPSALRFFSDLKKLQSLVLYGCRGIEDGEAVDRLQDALPNLRYLRLSSAAEEDGKMMVDEHEDDASADLASAADALAALHDGMEDVHDDDLAILDDEYLR